MRVLVEEGLVFRINGDNCHLLQFIDRKSREHLTNIIPEFDSEQRLSLWWTDGLVSHYIGI